MKTVNVFRWKKLFPACSLSVFLVVVAFTSVVIAGETSETASQLLEDRGIAVLSDSFVNLGNNKDPNAKAHLTIKNKTMHTLKVDLNGKNGQYHLEINPRSDKKWKITSGEYHFELHVPGHPSASGDMRLNSTTSYQWEIQKKQP